MGFIKSNKNLRCILAVFLVLGTFSLRAQVVNQGEVYVSSNTIFSIHNEFDNFTGAEFKNDGETYFFSQFNNDGEVDFVEGNGITIFSGNELQNITGLGSNYFFHIMFDNPTPLSAFHLYSDINVSGKVRFLRGIVDNVPYGGVFEFGPEGSQFDTSDSSHVNGPVNRMGGNEFIFPIGDGGFYRPGGIYAPENSEVYFIGEYFLGNSDEIHPHELKPDGVYSINKEEYWIIENEGQNTSNLFVTLSWNESTTPEDFITAAHHDQGLLTIVRWDEEANMWIDEGGVTDHDSNTITAKTEKTGLFTLAIMDKDLMSPCHIVVYNAVTPNGDGINDYFRIDNQGDCAKNLRVKIFDRWGIQVFESNDYGQNGDVFEGYSTGRMTLGKNSNRLPTGTYFYTLEYNYESANGMKRHRQAGYLYLSGN